MPENSSDRRRCPVDDTDPLMRLVARLEEFDQRRSGKNFQCPAHDDREPSLTVSRARNGLDVVLHCHAGCSTNAVLAALGFELADLFHPANRVSIASSSTSTGRSSLGTRDVRFTLTPNVLLSLTSSCPTGKRSSRPDLETLEREWMRGDCDPLPVTLGKMPDDATADMRRMAGDIEFLIGLFASAGEIRPLPYSARFAAQRMGWQNGRNRACRTLKQLTAAGVIDRVGALSVTGGQTRGTMLYAAPLQRGSLLAEVVGDHSVAEVVEQPTVNGTVSVRREHVRMSIGGDQ